MGRRARLKKLRKQQFNNRTIQQSSDKKQIVKLLDCYIVHAAYAAVILAIFSLAFTILKPGFPSGHDIAAHIMRSKVLKEALYQGQFPVRWIE